MADEFGEKTEAPTDKKISDARKEGNIPKSQEINVVIGLIVSFYAVYLFSGDFVKETKEFFIEIINQIHIPISDEGMVTYVYTLLRKYTLVFLKITVPIILPIVIAGITINVLQVGINFLIEPIVPKFSKLNPISGFTKMFSTKSLVDIVKNSAKLVAVAIVVYLTLKNEVYLLPLLADYTIWQIAVYISLLSMKVVFYIILLFLILGIFDFWFQRYNHIKQLKMTKQEIKDEARSQEGDPHIKGKIKQVQYEMAQRRMMESVPDATVVVTNPTFLAIAIKYEKGMKTPLVIAKGMKKTAEKIRDIATKNSVPIVENKPLARSMYGIVEPGDEVPVEFYEVVAEIIAYVYKLKEN